jgi:aldehyde:ferredoxin oxidoreductase
VVTKSPLTGGVVSSSVGGCFGTELKLAGFDLIIIEGGSESPVYLTIEDERVEFREAYHMWGKTTRRTEEILRGELDDPWRARETYIVSIGPAGEKLSKISSIVSEASREAGRFGAGAVMGSKNLKAIAVRGTQGFTVSDSKALKEVNAEALQKFKSVPVIPAALRNLGTAFLVNMVNEKGILPVKNFQTGVFKGAADLSGETITESILLKRKACFSCPTACGRVTQVIDPLFSDTGEGPEYEALALLGANCGIDDLKVVTRAAYRCRDLGLDTISMGSAAACAMELSERRYLTSRNSGEKLRFGNGKALLELIEKTAARQGVGALVAEGGYHLAQASGHPELFMGVRKQELPPYDPRGIDTLALEYATSNTGACHLCVHTVAHELFGLYEDVEPPITNDRAAFVKTFQDLTALVDACGLCPLVLIGLWVDDIGALLKAATGESMSNEDLLRVGERTWNLERAYNLRAGWKPEDDTLPERMLKEPMPEGPSEGSVCSLTEVLPRYYEQRGWDEGGVPTQSTLRKMNLDGWYEENQDTL